MNTRKTTLLIVTALALMAVAGVKVSQLTRTRSLQETSRFMVSTQDATSGKWSSRYITAPDLATNLGPWITNSGSGGESGNSISSDAGKGTNTDFYGTFEMFGSDLFSGATANVFSNSVTIGGDLSLQGYSDVAATLTALGTNTVYTSNQLYSLIVASGISAPTATNISRYFATNSAVITSNALYSFLAQKTNGTLYGTVTIDGGTANEILALDASKNITAVAGISATEAGALDGIDSNIQDQIDATPGSVSPQGFRLSNRLLERIADWRHMGLEFYDSFEREGLTNYPGTSDSGHIWGHAPIGTTTNLVWIGNGRFRHATNGPTGPHYWGVTRTNLSVNWGWFGGTVMYEGLGNNGWEDTATIILCRSLDFNTSQPYLHFRVLRTGLQVQLSQTNNLINETYPIPLTNNVFYTFNCYVHGNRLIAQVGNNRYEVTHDSLAQESITNATVLIYEHNRRTTNITSGWYASYGDAWAGALPFNMYRYMTDGIYRGSNGVINSITFADGTTQSTAGGGGSGGNGTNNPILLSGPTLAIIANQTARIQWATNADFAFAITGASNQSTIARMNFENTSTNTIHATNTSGLYATRDGSNVTVFPIPPLSILSLSAELDRSNRWVTVADTAEYALEFANGSTGTNHTTKKITYTAPSGGGSASFNETNITVSTTNEIVLDLAAFDVAKIKLLTNLNVLTFTNVSTMGKRAQVYFQQDTNGVRLIDQTRVAGGLIQTNANLQPTTNANALDMLEIMPGFFSSNAVAWWPQNFQPRVPFTNSLASGVSIAFRALETNIFSANNFVMNKPAGTATGDTLLLFSVTDSPSIITNTGWTLIESNANAGAGFTVYSRVADGTEGSTITFRYNDIESGGALLVAYSGANATTPVDQTAVETGAPGAGAEHITATITPSVDNAMLISCIYIDPTSDPTYTSVVGYTLRGFVMRSTSGTLAIADKLQTTATLEGGRIIESVGGTWGEFTMSLKP